MTAITSGNLVDVNLLMCTALKWIWAISVTSHKSTPKVCEQLLWFLVGLAEDTHAHRAAKILTQIFAKVYRNPESYAQCHSFERIWALTWGAN